MAEYGIKYPTEWGYDHREGEQEVDKALTDLANERCLDVRRIKGWQRVELPSPGSDIRALIDCALYRVQLK